MGFIKEIFSKDITKRILVLLTLIIIFYAMRHLANLFLLTFLFTYLMNSLQKVISRRLGRIIQVSHVIVTIFLYVIFAALITFFITKYIPKISEEIANIVKEISNLVLNTQTYFKQYLDPNIETRIYDTISKYGQEAPTQILNLVKNVGIWTFNVFVALMLSMFFMLEKDKVVEFLDKFNNSRLSGFFRYLQLFGHNFLNSFGKVIQAQILIAFTNAVLSSIALGIMGFPQILGLAVMIFIFSLIPVAGTIISFIPLSIIAYNLNGIKMVLYVALVIVGLHALESYVLNPKFMADKTDLPVFIIFLVLLISEHFMGVWGLLIGVPLFMFFLDLMNVKVEDK